MSIEPVTIIGLGIHGLHELPETARERIQQADELWGGERHLEQAHAYTGKKVKIDRNIQQTLKTLTQRAENAKVVVLASGDPAFFGIAATILKVLPPDEVEILPQASTLQYAFAKCAIPWQDAALTSAHARPLSEVIGLAKRHAKLGILTDPTQTPAVIAAQLLAAGIPDCRAIVCENLGLEDERITDSQLSVITDKTFSPLNVLLLIQDEHWQPAPVVQHRSDDAYSHQRGLITKQDVRIISIQRLGVRETDIIWDIGAGSGAMSVEMAELAWRGQVYAIEKKDENLQCIHKNKDRFAIHNLQIITGEAPQALAALPQPSAVFIGGSSGKLSAILDSIHDIINQPCRVVANFTLLENLMEGMQWMKDHGYQASFTEVQFSYSSPIGNGTRLAPINPVFILHGTLHKEDSE